MQFKEFERLVKEKHPNAEVTAHGKFGGDSKIGVTVIFEPMGKCYHYNGTYCEVLNRLGIKAIYRHDYDEARRSLERLKRQNGTRDVWFGHIKDYTIEINCYEKQIKKYENEYIII